MNSIHPEPEVLREEVRRRYGAIAGTEPSATVAAAAPTTCCQPPPPGAAAPGCGCQPDTQARALGYSAGDLASVPAGANLNLGCGNPVALASLQPGQTVLDLGSGAGFDALLAARAVGPDGRVIGVDMTPEMIAKARANARKGGFAQVEFRLGEIEALPVADACVDVVISNCVINLCPDKTAVYREAFRVLRPGGRLAVSDVVAYGPMPAEVTQDLALHTGCLAGATARDELVQVLAAAGFTDIAVRPKGNTDEIIGSWSAARRFESLVFAAEVTATKPAAGCCAPTCCA